MTTSPIPASSAASWRLQPRGGLEVEAEKCCRASRRETSASGVDSKLDSLFGRRHLIAPRDGCELVEVGKSLDAKSYVAAGVSTKDKANSRLSEIYVQWFNYCPEPDFADWP